MEQVPHWLEKTVFAAGMTAYAVEVDAKQADEPAHSGAAPAQEDAPDSYH